MAKRLISKLTALAAAACVAGLTVQIATAQIAAAGETAAPASPKDDPAAQQPQRYPETPAEVAECVKTWDKDTGMSQAEYEAACKRTLKYYPEKVDTPPAKP